MEGLGLATTVITLATFIKDLIEVGQSIKESIEKVGENRRQIRELANDVLRSLADIANLTRGKEDEYQAPALLGALGDLKADMLHVLSVCRKVIPAERRPGLRGIGSQVKIWMKRDEVEREIRRLKEHVNACYIKFTAFSAARIEETTACVDETTARIEDMSLDTVNTTLRVEQTLIVNHVENRVQLRRLEGMMAQVLLETPFGQNVMDRTIEIISYDPKHESLESQYLSAQIMHLIESLQHLVTGRNFDLDPNMLSGMKDMFAAPTTPLHLLHEILGMILDIQNGTLGWISSDGHLIFNLGSDMCGLGLISEAIAWELLVIQILGHGAPSDCSGRIMSQLARSRRNLSHRYQYQLQYELALQASEQSLHILHSFLDPPLDLLSISMATLVTHSINLCQVGQHKVAITIAQEAVMTCRPMVARVIPFASDMSAEEEYNVVISSQAFFTLAQSLSTVGRHLEAYEASKEGFQTVLKFSGFIRPPAGEYIDSFIHQICKVAEEDELSLSMLREMVILFRDLTRNYPEEFSPQFLQLFYAYMYLDEQKTSPNFSASVKTLRIFLEPESRSPPPSLGESNNSFVISDFDQYGGVIEDAIRACYVLSWETEDIRAPLLRKIFPSNFDQAITILQGVAPSSMTESWHPDHLLTWAVYDIIVVLLPCFPHSQQSVLLEVMVKFLGYIRAMIPSATAETGRWSFAAMLWHCSLGFWFTVQLHDALAAADEAIEQLHSYFNADNLEQVEQRYLFQLCRASILYDMGRLVEAIDAVQPDKVSPGVSDSEVIQIQVMRHCLIQTRILRQTGRNREARQILRRVISTSGGRGLTEKSDPYSFWFRILLAELSAVHRNVGHPEKALKHAERGVAGCRKFVEESPTDMQDVLVSHLKGLSDCLAAVGRDNEALLAAKEAVLIYAAIPPYTWSPFLIPLRSQEMGANCFRSLSLRLTTFGQLDEALANAEKATGLYRELVSLAPVHQPSLARSLRDVASILWKLGRQDESIEAMEEVVVLMQKVADNETYFLTALIEALDQLSGYLSKRGDTERASAAASEVAAAVRTKIASLPPEPDFLFEEIEREPEVEIHGPEDILEDTTFLIEAERAIAPLTEIAAAPAASEVVEVAISQDFSLVQTVETSVLAAEETPVACDTIPASQAREVTGKNGGKHVIEAAISAKTRLAAFLATSLEAKIEVKAKDILWSIFLVILGWAFSVVWSRI